MTYADNIKKKTDEEIVEEEVIEQAKRIWGRPYDAKERPWLDLPYTHCTYCDPSDIKKPCVCNVVDGTALCCRHWIEERIKERLALMPKPVMTIKLDLEDFARLG